VLRAISLFFAGLTAIIVVLIVARHGFRMQSETSAFDQDFATLQILGVIARLLSVGAAAAHLVIIRDRY
jgi:hypothetical protein